MNSFLHAVAEHLCATFHNDLANVVVVFPNKRAALFLNQELVSLAQQSGGTPIWAPQCQTINELFEELSPYSVADPIVSVCRLYEVYSQVLGAEHVETIDKFYGWGEVILNDFNDIDKQLVDVDQLFKFAHDWKQLSNTDFLNDEQIMALQRYFSSFSQETMVAAKERFLQLWKVMPAIYHGFAEQLKKDNQLYDGALARHVVENQLFVHLDSEKTYIFAGFNVLTRVEYGLLKGIKDTGHARFYWDYDEALTPDEVGLKKLLYDASLFIRDNLHHLPNELKPGWSLTEESTLEIAFFKTDTANAQSRYVPQWIASDGVGVSPKTAVVLADESLLSQVLFTLPACKVNITMGYSLSDTPVMGFITSLIDLQTKGLRKGKGGFLAFYQRRVEIHPLALGDKSVWCRSVESTGSALLQYLDQNVLEVLSRMEDHTDDMHALLYEESLYRAHVAIRQLADLHMELDVKLTCMLLERVLRSTKVPFHGEPIEGLQVMGMLETRVLDFDNLLVLSANDGVLPKKAASGSLIPYCMREPFGLTTEKEQVNVYAYNFFRLIQRARQVTMMFVASGSNMGKSEMSRFMRQLLAETDLDIATCHLDFGKSDRQCPTPRLSETSFPKTKEALSRIERKGNGEQWTDSSNNVHINTLSPSAINTYINCPLQFYYRYVENIKVEEDVTSTLEANQLGTIFHKAAENFYTVLAPTGWVTRQALSQVSDTAISEAVDAAFRSEVFNNPDSDVDDYVGELVIARDVVLEYLHRLIALDLQSTPFRILQMEQHHATQVEIQVAGNPIRVHIGGNIDRLDYLEQSGTIRVVDYKTSGDQKNSVLTEDDVPSLFSLDQKKPNKYMLQTFLYSQAVMDELDKKSGEGSLALTPEQQLSPIVPVLFYVNQANDAQNFDPRLQIANNAVDNYRIRSEEFKIALQHFLETELFNPNQDFTATEKVDHCTFCDYRLLCGRAN